MVSKERVRLLADTHFERVREIRRHLHMNPELSFQEWKTAEFVARTLGEAGIQFREGVAGTGIVAEISGKNPHSNSVALRADMDALPIQEENEVPYKSKNPGVMHACGHDVHTSSLLGAALILRELEGEFEGSIRLIFQPGEERIPGGASLMIKEGVLEKPRPSHIIGQHVMPQLPVGKVGFRSGMYMASADEIYMTIYGKGGHAAIPENFIDPVLISAHIITALQQIVSRVASPKIPSVLSFGKVEANGATNIIPDKVYLEGTFRTMDETWRAEAHARIEAICMGLAESMGGKCEIEIRKGYPFLVNEPVLTGKLKAHASEFLGADNVVDLDLWMAAEDFSYYSQVANACFYRLGVRNEHKSIVSGVHTPTFDIDEDALRIGAGLMAYLALAEINQTRH